jgi:HSP20 family molecular chaperone IbpA
MKESTVAAPEEQEVTQRNEEGVQDTRETARSIAPPVDIYETEEGLTVVADLPGVEKENVDVRVEKGVLTLNARTSNGFIQEPLHREWTLRNYFRQFALSEEVDQEKIEAEMKHGVLTIKLPRREEAKPRQIQVNVS